MALDSAAVLKVVARLVMDYLDEQNLTDAYNTFCETSRHISDEEYSAYSQGIKPIDTGLCLINIVKEYFDIKDKFRDFIRACPKTSIINSLIDTTNIESRLDIILKVLKDNLLKIDQIQEQVSRKRRKTENELFEVSQTNTSTPESAQPLKKRRLATSLITNNNETVVSAKKDLKSVLSSPETSNKEDDVTDDEALIKPTGSNSKIAPPPELLSETLLNKPDFAENLAEIINKTLAERGEEHEKSTEASNSQNLLTQHDVQDILSKTEDKNNFEDILKEVIDKYLIDGSENINANNDSLTSTPTENAAEDKVDEVPIKQRLRPRTAKKAPPSERKKNKINIISDELISGPLSMHIPTNQPTIESSQPLILVPIMPSSTTFIPIHSFQSTSNIICENNNLPITTTAEIPTSVQIILTENSPALPSSLQTISTVSITNNNNNNNENNTNAENEQQKEVTEKTQKTPKSTIQPGFLESKCKSTPRRKASHVRILDFNSHQTPSARLATIKECKTPLNAIRTDTPGSAPSIMVSQRTKVEKKTVVAESTENTDKSIEIIDDSSNSNSISNTPKVAKNRRRRKIEVDSKLDKTHEEVSPKPMTQEEWIKMREQQKSMSVDERMRILFQQNEEKTNVKKRRSQTKKKKKDDGKVQENGSAKKKSRPISTTLQHGKSKFGAKFKVTSPRKSALLRKTPKKKKLSSENLPSIENKENKLAQTQKDEPPKSEVLKDSKEKQLSVPKLTSPEAVAVTAVDNKKEESLSNELNRSDTVQEVAKLLTNLPETILAKTNSGNNFEQNIQQIAPVDPSILLETPLKIDSISPLPNTPRFAVPLISTHQETPLAKEVVPVTTVPSILKHCDILTPSFPITPGFKVTPAKSEASPSGYSSRKTDYSSCSSYYKPDESEEINQNFDNILKQSRADRSSQSESEGGHLAIIDVPKRTEKVRAGSTKKVECPGALDRVLSFTEDTNAVMMPHYNMNEEGLLSESLITTGSDDSSSSFTCSTCSTDPSSDEDTMVKLSKALTAEERDTEWHCDEEIEIEKSNNSLVDEKTGEVRFPLRNWITPKKIDPQETITSIIAAKKPEVIKTQTILTTICTETVVSVEEKKKEEHKKIIAELEEKKQRTLKILKKESVTIAKKVPAPKFRKSNVKQFKLPAEQPKAPILTRRDQILQQNLTERPKSTALTLMPSASTTSSSSSRRKCLTPRKTIVMDELPKADPSAKKSSKKRQSSEKSKTDNVKIIKSPVKPEKVSVENINDNAVMNDEHPSLNISTSFHDTSDEEPENTVVKAAQKGNEEGSNTFQRTLIAQGFDKSEAKDLQIKLIDKIEEQQQKAESTKKEDPLPETPKGSETPKESEKLKEPEVQPKEKEIEPAAKEDVPENESEEEEEEECDFALSDFHEKNTFCFEEPPDFVAAKIDPKPKIKLCAPSKLQIDGRTVKIDFSDTMDLFSLEPTEKQTDCKAQEKKEPKDASKASEPKILTKEISIDKILAMIHGKH